MIWPLFKIDNLKIYLIVGLAIAGVWFYKDYQRTKADNVRIKENAEQVRKADSIGFSQQILTKEELIQDLKYNRQDLVRKLEQQDIKLNRITRLINVQNQFTDVDTTTFLLNKILKGIQENKAVTQAVRDTSECYVVEANIRFDGQQLNLDVTKVAFTSESDIVAYTEKVGLRFWKWFRKKNIEVTVINSCGEIKTSIIDVKKK